MGANHRSAQYHGLEVGEGPRDFTLRGHAGQPWSRAVLNLSVVSCQLSVAKRGRVEARVFYRCFRAWTKGASGATARLTRRVLRSRPVRGGANLERRWLAVLQGRLYQGQRAPGYEPPHLRCESMRATSDQGLARPPTVSSVSSPRRARTFKRSALPQNAYRLLRSVFATDD